MTNYDLGTLFICLLFGGVAVALALGLILGWRAERKQRR